MTLNWNYLPKEIATKLRAFHRRRQLFRFLRIQFAIFGIYAILLLAATHADRFFFLETGQRVALFWGVHGIAIMLWAACMARVLLKKISSTSVAYAFESALEQALESTQGFIECSDKFITCCPRSSPEFLKCCPADSERCEHTAQYNTL